MLSEQAISRVLSVMAEKKKDAETACNLCGMSFDAFLRFMEVGLIEQTHVHNGGTVRKKNAPMLRAYVDLKRVQAGGGFDADSDD